MRDSQPVLFVSHRFNENDSPMLTLSCSSEGGAGTPALDILQSVKEPVTTPRYAEFAVVKPFFRYVFRVRPRRVVFDELCADTADLVRMLVALEIVVEVLSEPGKALQESDCLELDAAAERWVRGLLDLLDREGATKPEEACAGGALTAANDVGYEEYAFGSRSHSLLILWVERVLRFFEGRGPVLDIGCGTGVFLDQLARRGIDVRGVDENSASVRYAKSFGLQVELADGAHYLERHPNHFDAIHCSHLVEHLPFGDLQQFMTLLSGALRPGGRAVFVFPDPESIRSQLLGFWRDPDHVRLYHPDTIELLAASAGLDLEFNSQHEMGRTVVSFPMEPLESASLNARDDTEEVNSDRALLRYLKSRVEQHEQWIKHLWQVNQTWAWADDAVLVFSKPHF